MELLNLNEDVLGIIFALMVNYQDILSLKATSKYCQQLIVKSTQTILTCPRNYLRSNQIISYVNLNQVKPSLLLDTSLDFLKLAPRLISANFDFSYLHITLEKAFPLIKEYLKQHQKRHQHNRTFCFGNKICVNAQKLIYLNRDEESLVSFVNQLSFTSLVSRWILDVFPSQIQDIIYVTTYHPLRIPLLDSCFNRRSFAVVSCDTDLSRQGVATFLLFGEEFLSSFTHQQYPLLRKLLIPLDVGSFDFCHRHSFFPNLRETSLVVHNQNDEKNVELYIKSLQTRSLQVIWIYTIREDIRFRISKWRFLNIQVIPSYIPQLRYLT